MDDIEISRLLDGTSLGHGAHPSRAAGMCAMEFVSYIAGEPHSYDPACVSPLLTGFTIRLNDHMNESVRQRLKPFLPRLVGTNTGEERRRFEAMARTAVTVLVAPMLADQGATGLAKALRRHAQAPLREIAGRLCRPERDAVGGRLRRFLSRDLGRAFELAVVASERRQYGFQPNWNWCGGELGNAVSAVARLGGNGGWAAALQVLEAGIEAVLPDAAEPPATAEATVDAGLLEALP